MADGDQTVSSPTSHIYKLQKVIKLIFCFFTEEIEALREVWIVGDHFLHQNFDVFQQQKSTAILDHKDPPHLYQFYGISAWYVNLISFLKPTTARLQNALVKALNKKTYLPKYVIMMPDIDILRTLHAWGPGANEKIESQLNWIIAEVAKLLIVRRDDLKAKHAGSVTADLTRVVWVGMLTRPFTENQTFKKVWALKKKFNGILKSLLHVEKYMHFIEVDHMEERKYFDKFGDLSSSGKHAFWSNLNAAIKVLDSNGNALNESRNKATNEAAAATASPINFVKKIHNNFRKNMGFNRFKTMKRSRQQAVQNNQKVKRRLDTEFYNIPDEVTTEE